VNLGNLGVSELLLVLLAALVFRILPIVFAIWVIVDIRRIRRRLDTLTSRVDALERVAGSAR
jgi:hypothetical protein